MPRRPAWMNRSCAIVRPHTRIVVCSRWSAVNVRGTSSNQCFWPSTGRPRRLRSSSSNCLSCASMASSEVGSRSAPLLSFVVLILVFPLALGPHHVEGRGALRLGPVCIVLCRPLGDLRLERLHFVVQLVVGPSELRQL